MTDIALQEERQFQRWLKHFPGLPPCPSDIISSDIMRADGLLPNDVVDRAEGVIYMATNRLNGARYIGATATSLTLRWHRHVQRAKRVVRSPLHYDLRKKGRQAFQVEQIASCLRIEHLAWLEAELIAQNTPEYNRTVPEDVWEHLR